MSSKHAEPEPTRRNALLRASCLAIGVDIGLILLKYLLTRLTGNPVLLADTLHSGGDLAVSVIVLLSIIIHDYFRDNRWLKEAECLVALLISLLLMTGSVRIILRVWANQTHQFLVLRGIPLVIAIAGISTALAVTFAMARFKRQVGEKHASIAFLAEGKHTYSDFLTSSGVWITLVMGYFGIHLERIMTLLVGLAVFHIGMRLFFQASFSFRITPVIVSWGKKMLSSRIRTRVRNLRQALRRFYDIVTSLTPSPFFSREQWIFSHKRSLIIGNVGFIVFLYIGTGFYTVLPHQTGLELLFGKVVEKNPPGWHLHVPKPFGNIVRVATGITARVESGFRTKWYFSEKEPDAYLWEFAHNEGRYQKIPNEAMAMTGDEILIDANFLCYYRITDPVVYAFHNENAHEVLRSVFGHELHAVLGRYELDMLLTSARGRVQTELLDRMKNIVGQLPLGVEILHIYMREAHPPLQVIPSYRAVDSARERKIKIIHAANTYVNERLPGAKGQAAEKVFQAQADAMEKVSVATGRTESFLLQQHIFRQSEAVQRIRLWWETVENVLMGKSLYILPKDARRRMYPNAESMSGIQGRNRYDTDDNYEKLTQ